MGEDENHSRTHHLQYLLQLLLKKKVDVKNKRTGIIISGGNIDLGYFWKYLSDIILKF
jgi:threonine dehydratase